MYIRFIVLFYALLISLTSMAAPVNFCAEVDAKSVLLGRTVELRFILENAQGNNFVPPSLEGFKVLHGPSREFSSTFNNGKKSYSETYTYLLQATKVGIQTIPEASIKTNTNILKTKPLHIEIVQKEPSASNSPLPSNPEEVPVFLTAELSKKEVYEGEQIQLMYRIYTRLGVEGIDILAEPKYDGFFVKNLERYDKTTTTQKIGTYDYQTRIIAAVALFPMRTGTIDIEPLGVQAGVVMQTQSRDPFAAIMGRNIKPTFLNTNPKTITVKTLPPAPAHFSGAVGTYRLEASLDKNEVAADESATLQIHVTGNGDGRRVELPKPPLPAGFEAFDPKPGMGETYETLDEIRHEQTWDVFILPKNEGNYEIKPSFCYFDTDSSDFITLESPAISLNARPETGKHTGNIMEDLSQKSPDFSVQLTRWLQSPYLWAVLLLPLFIIGITTLLKKQKGKPEGKPPSKQFKPEEKPLTTATKVPPTNALQGLAKLDRSNPKAFYAGLERTLVESATQKTGLPLNDTGRFDLVERIRQTHPSDTLADELDGLLETCEKAVYGGLTMADQTDVHFARAASVLKRLGT